MANYYTLNDLRKNCKLEESKTYRDSWCLDTAYTTEEDSNGVIYNTEVTVYEIYETEESYDEEAFLNDSDKPYYSFTDPKTVDCGVTVRFEKEGDPDWFLQASWYASDEHIGKDNLFYPSECFETWRDARREAKHLISDLGIADIADDIIDREGSDELKELVGKLHKSENSSEKK